MTISKRDAMQLVNEIRRANVSGHAIVARTGGHGSSVYGFLGGLESVLRHFLEKQGCREAAAELVRAMNEVPTDAEVAAHNEEISRWRAKAIGSAA
jgi:hypothetical protein